MKSSRFAVWVASHATQGINSIALLFALATIARALLVTLIPLRALDHFGSAQSVSVLYLCVSIAALAGNLCVPVLIQLMRRRWVLFLGLGMQVVGAPLLSAESTPWFVAGMVVQALGVAASELTLNVFLLDHVPRRDLARVEPLRLFYAGIGWTLGPWLGVYLWEHIAWLPFASAAAGAVLVGIYFWWLGFIDLPKKTYERPSNPLRYLPRFFAQPRLVLAWCLAFGRSSWWVVFYIYGPIYLIQIGTEASTTAAIASLANAGIFLVKIWGRVGRRYGLRRLLFWGYGLTCALSLVVTVLPGVPWIIGAALLAATLGASVIDGAGNVPFLRAVHSYERPEMTSVFMTYRDTAQLIPPAIFSLLLRVIALPHVFAVSAAGLLVLIIYIKHVPRRL